MRDPNPANGSRLCRQTSLARQPCSLAAAAREANLGDRSGRWRRAPRGAVLPHQTAAAIARLTGTDWQAWDDATCRAGMHRVPVGIGH